MFYAFLYFYNLMIKMNHLYNEYLCVCVAVDVYVHM